MFSFLKAAFAILWKEKIEKKYYRSKFVGIILAIWSDWPKKKISETKYSFSGTDRGKC